MSDNLQSHGRGVLKSVPAGHERSTELIHRIRSRNEERANESQGLVSLSHLISTPTAWVEVQRAIAFDAVLCRVSQQEFREAVVGSGCDCRVHSSAHEKPSHDHVINMQGVECNEDPDHSTPPCSDDGSSETGGNFCRICQQRSEEEVVELGCHCRGDMASAHPTCIEQWFSRKGTNKCEICLQVAPTVPKYEIARFEQERREGEDALTESDIESVGESSEPEDDAEDARVPDCRTTVLIVCAAVVFFCFYKIVKGSTAIPSIILVALLLMIVTVSQSYDIHFSCVQSNTRRGPV